MHLGHNVNKHPLRLMAPLPSPRLSLSYIEISSCFCFQEQQDHSLAFGDQTILDNKVTEMRLKKTFGNE